MKYSKIPKKLEMFKIGDADIQPKFYVIEKIFSTPMLSFLLSEVEDVCFENINGYIDTW